MGRTWTISILCQASAPTRELKPPDLQHLVCQPTRAQPGEACHHYHRGLYSCPQRQSQKCTAAIQGIPSIQISTSDIILGFCEPVLWFTRRSIPTIPALLSLHVKDLSSLWCTDLTYAATLHWNRMPIRTSCKVLNILYICFKLHSLIGHMWNDTFYNRCSSFVFTKDYLHLYSLLAEQVKEQKAKELQPCRRMHYCPFAKCLHSLQVSCRKLTCVTKKAGV